MSTPNETPKSNEMRANLSFDDKVIKKISGLAINEIPGILAMDGGLIGNLTGKISDAISSDKDNDPTKGIDAEVGQKQVALDLDVICEYGQNIPEIFSQATALIKKRIHDMTGLDVVEVNMHVKDVISKEDFGNEKSSAKKASDDSSSLAPRVK